MGGSEGKVGDVQPDDIEFLSNAAVRLAELGSTEDLFEHIANELSTLAPEAVVTASSYDPTTGCTVVRAIAGPEKMLAAARLLLGRDPVGITLCMVDEARQGLAEGKLMQLPGGLHQLTFYQVPLEVCRALEEQLGIKSVSAQPFARKGDFLGTAAIISTEKHLARARLIEAFVRQAAVVIQRVRAEMQLRESERRFRTLAENSQDVLFRWRQDAFEYVSPASTALLGYTPEEFYLTPNLALENIRAEDRAVLERALYQPPGEPVAICWRRREGAEVWVEVKLSAVRDPSGAIEAVEGIARDITARKQTEQALLEADRRKDEFLAVLSHELRNPLAPIQNSLFILDRVPPGSERAKRARAVIDRQVSHMTRLIDDLLDVTRISRGKIALRSERFELNDLLSRTIEDHRSLFAGGGIDLELASEPGEVWLDADRTRIAQVLGNLLQNAAKFTPPGGRTTVTVTTGPGAWVHVRVRDTGVGIPDEMLPRVFEPFVQADRTLDRRRGGLGLGLALVKGIVELHGGRVRASSDGIGRGTEIEVILPMAASTQAGLDLGREAPARARHRVLVIEDNVDIATTLREALELEGHDVEVAFSGLEGIAKARNVVPDLVLCDIGLPGIDGYEVARQMREDPRFAETMLVAVSGYATKQDVTRARDAGFDRHIAKPPSLERLLELAAKPERRAAS